jgi:hypothetical protein
MTWASWMDFALGLWLIISPFVLRFRDLSGKATGDTIVFGILIAAFSLWTAMSADAPSVASWLVMLFGLWIAISPFVLGFRSFPRALSDSVVVGIIVLVLAVVRATARRPLGPTAAA